MANGFLDELARHPTPVTRPLPRELAPLARSVAGTTSVRVSSGTASRMALAAFDKRAATTGKIIHLAEPIDHTPATFEVLAHEMAHVGAPSRGPRFFDDHRIDHEERHAHRVGRRVAEVAAAAERTQGPRGGTRGLPVGGVSGLLGSLDERPAAPTPMRRPAESAPPRKIARSPAHTSASWSAAEVQRSPVRQTWSAGGVPVASEGAGGTVQRLLGDGGAAAFGAATDQAAAEAVDQPRSRLNAADVDRIVRAVERRVIEDLERRGRRRPGVF